jgi:hypothetical protein
VLVADVALARPVDAIALLGRAVTIAAGGTGHPSDREAAGAPASTVRGWPTMPARR